MGSGRCWKQCIPNQKLHHIALSLDGRFGRFPAYGLFPAAPHACRCSRSDFRKSPLGNALRLGPRRRHAPNPELPWPGASEVVASSSRKSRLGIRRKLSPFPRRPKTTDAGFTGGASLALGFRSGKAKPFGDPDISRVFQRIFGGNPVRYALSTKTGVSTVDRPANIRESVIGQLIR